MEIKMNKLVLSVDKELAVPPTKWGYKEAECPLCHESYSISPGDGVRNNTLIEPGSPEWDETCPHWFCCICVDKMCEDGVDRCPFCDKDISELTEAHYDCVHGDDEVPPKWGYNQDTECPACHEPYTIPKDGCRNHDFAEEDTEEWDSLCPHWFCCVCIDKMCLDGVDQCPACHKDITELVATHYRCVYGSDSDVESDC